MLFIYLEAARSADPPKKIMQETWVLLGFCWGFFSCCFFPLILHNQQSKITLKIYGETAEF